MRRKGLSVQMKTGKRGRPAREFVSRINTGWSGEAATNEIVMSVFKFGKSSTNSINKAGSYGTTIGYYVQFTTNSLSKSAPLAWEKFNF